MQFSKTILLIAAAIVPAVMAGCSGAAPYQGTCAKCAGECHKNFGGPDRLSSLQRAGCQTNCLLHCNDCN
ncbi:hypothetical protein HER10_EVM0000483 [Colletotrichum scovillei]|uniref:Uncharacterized protein n=1 Tax=Colletotrichum scovillei TaxID=1209932 RepID=A0A9P7QW58_9PEZI|nr:uncharacterized protein HER10_EVM0000483 [Colletotrichum scovillei]KAF4783808.1 hypothetical protein HER10_EVM0000483 [Colletotrichum scovillei]KAG7039992.1 hypothetical protein JMJ78_0011649 [Colletotrichum scovillei]KAG7042168.1 hypothetical protein JMJ77_0010271 [Colletotrichum scovillei]KAG7062201.1 hypothetical protein JMJ76_0006479 [Colletotrichum scovillei]